jgi:hypothetical protein
MKIAYGLFFFCCCLAYVPTNANVQCRYVRPRNEERGREEGGGVYASRPQGSSQERGASVSQRKARQAGKNQNNPLTGLMMPACNTGQDRLRQVLVGTDPP